MSSNLLKIANLGLKFGLLYREVSWLKCPLLGRFHYFIHDKFLIVGSDTEGS
jgi:hypothetical protein